MEEAKLLINCEADMKEVTAMQEIFRWHYIRTRRTFELTYGNHSYEYIIKAANKNWGINTSIPVKFYLRWRDGHVKTKMPESYLNDIDIQDTLRAFHLDAEKFWYLSVFILDVVEGFVTDTVEEVTQMDELISLCDALNEAKPVIPEINKTFASGDWCPAESNSVLSVKVGNKNMVSITNYMTLCTIQYILKDFIQNNRANRYLNDSSFTVKKGKDKPAMMKLVLFNRYLIDFLQSITVDTSVKPSDRIVERKTIDGDVKKIVMKDGSICYDKSTLIGRMAYELGIAVDRYGKPNEKFKEVGYFKNYIKKDKDKRISATNCRYMIKGG
jgi:hypothetical protein